MQLLQWWGAARLLGPRLGLSACGRGLGWLQGWRWLRARRRRPGVWWCLVRLRSLLASCHPGQLSLGPLHRQAHPLGVGGSCPWGR